jgi:hypothetical protein
VSAGEPKAPNTGPIPAASTVVVAAPPIESAIVAGELTKKTETASDVRAGLKDQSPAQSASGGAPIARPVMMPTEEPSSVCAAQPRE